MSTVTYDPQDTESGSESQPLVTVDVSSRQRSVRWLRRAGHWTKDNLLLILTVVSVVVGIIVGLSVHAAHPGRVAGRNYCPPWRTVSSQAQNANSSPHHI